MPAPRRAIIHRKTSPREPRAANIRPMDGQHGGRPENQTPRKQGGRRNPRKQRRRRENQTPGQQGGRRENQTPGKQGGRRNPRKQGMQSENQIPGQQGGRRENKVRGPERRRKLTISSLDVKQDRFPRDLSLIPGIAERHCAVQQEELLNFPPPAPSTPEPTKLDRVPDVAEEITGNQRQVDEADLIPFRSVPQMIQKFTPAITKTNSLPLKLEMQTVQTLQHLHFKALDADDTSSERTNSERTIKEQGTTTSQRRKHGSKLKNQANKDGKRRAVKNRGGGTESGGGRCEGGAKGKGKARMQAVEEETSGLSSVVSSSGSKSLKKMPPKKKACTSGVLPVGQRDLPEASGSRRHTNRGFKGAAKPDGA
ncbi:hypothetical protein FN846DRAFT_886190 [Sphaerosporella brunnea]|uniref:Uncharacterized protein n=1 Tax=Sphaerosporella brunnea TaxID=1250544 RepID=A0A5J5FAG6_9PEZI|nr:hypothetical protein FN846DRAFT_886190 [Sphaerosporella brunnea]